jgi:hypothetical protein
MTPFRVISGPSRFTSLAQAGRSCSGASDEEIFVRRRSFLSCRLLTVRYFNFRQSAVADPLPATGLKPGPPGIDEETRTMRITASVTARRLALDVAMLLGAAFVMMRIAETPSLRSIFL